MLGRDIKYLEEQDKKQGGSSKPIIGGKEFHVEKPLRSGGNLLENQKLHKLAPT